MDERLKAEMEDIQAMFAHPGWIALKRQTQERIDNFRTGFPFNVENERQLYFSRGVIASLTELVNLDAPPPEDDYDPQQDLPV